MYSIRLLVVFALSISYIGTVWAERINIAYSAITGSQAPLWVAKDEGIFKGHGFDVELIYISGGSIVTNALLAGNVQLARLGPNAVLQASTRGADLKMIANTMNTLVTSMMVKADIHNLKDLTGKRIGVTRLGGNVDYALDLVLKRAGLQRGKDVIVLQTGGNPQLLASLAAGTVDAGILSSPTNLRAARFGMRELVDFSELGIAYPASIIAATRQYLTENRKTVLRFMRAYCEGINRVFKNPAATMKSISHYSQEKDPQILAEVYRVYGVKHLEKIPYVKVDGVQEVLRAENMRASEMNAMNFIDNSFVNELEQEGFFRKLYKQ
jgi:ABC-type nitrate/sulfonate/bicarbonate transport system substrate-binding protein